MKILVVFLFLFSCQISFAKHLHHEQYYQQLDCPKQGKITSIEYVLSDKTRVDCLTEEYAIEYDFAKKGYECISQAIHYSNMTGKKAKCILIQESESDLKYIKRAKTIANTINSCVKLIYIDVIN